MTQLRHVMFVDTSRSNLEFNFRQLRSNYCSRRWFYYWYSSIQYIYKPTTIHIHFIFLLFILSPFILFFNCEWQWFTSISHFSTIISLFFSITPFSTSFFSFISPFFIVDESWAYLSFSSLLSFYSLSSHSSSSSFFFVTYVRGIESVSNRSATLWYGWCVYHCKIDQENDWKRSDVFADDKRRKEGKNKRYTIYIVHVLIIVILD